MGCRRTANKEEFLRIVRLPSGGVRPDPEAHLPGRGAYLCRNAQCLARAIRTGALQRALKCPVPEEVREKIREIIGNDGS